MNHYPITSINPDYIHVFLFKGKIVLLLVTIIIIKPEIMKIFILISLLFFTFMVNAATKVYFVNQKSQADLVIYIVNQKSQANLIISYTNNKYDHGKNIWYVVNQKSQADIKVYITNVKSQADKRVYITNTKSQISRD